VIRQTAVAVAVAVAVAGCGTGGRPAGSPTKASTTTATAVRPSAGSGCRSDAAKGTQVRFTNQAGASLAGVLLGSSATGVLLAHQSDGDVCQWLPFANDLADAGYRVLAFDFAGDGASDPAGNSTLDGDVVAATGFLREHGATAVVLVGASMGGTAVVAAAPAVKPPPAGVVSLSGPARFAGVDAQHAAAALTVPVLYAAGDGDENFAAQARSLYDATPTTVDRTLVVVHSSEHGVDFVNDHGDTARQVRQAMLDFLMAHG